MTRDGLSAGLARPEVPPSIVTFDGPGIGECYTLEHRTTGYVVNYAERDERRAEQTFASESVALRYPLGWTIDDKR